MGTCTKGEVKDRTPSRTNVQYDNTINMIVINCQSLKSKKAKFGEFIDTHSPDVIFGSESWLSPSIHTSEIFPHNFDVCRRDRSD